VGQTSESHFTNVKKKHWTRVHSRIPAA